MTVYHADGESCGLEIIAYGIAVRSGIFGSKGSEMNVDGDNLAGVLLHESIGDGVSIRAIDTLVACKLFNYGNAVGGLGGDEFGKRGGLFLIGAVAGGRSVGIDGVGTTSTAHQCQCGEGKEQFLHGLQFILGNFFFSNCPDC